jgi:hypothetical protein
MRLDDPNSIFPRILSSLKYSPSRPRMASLSRAVHDFLPLLGVAHLAELRNGLDDAGCDELERNVNAKAE